MAGQTIQQILDTALREIELLLITVPLTEREGRIFGVAARALNIADGEKARRDEVLPELDGKRWAEMPASNH